MYTCTFSVCDLGQKRMLIFAQAVVHLCSSFAQQPSQPWQATKRGWCHAVVNGAIGATSIGKIAGHATERGYQERSESSKIK